MQDFHNAVEYTPFGIAATPEDATGASENQNVFIVQILIRRNERFICRITSRAPAQRIEEIQNILPATQTALRDELVRNAFILVNLDAR